MINLLPLNENQLARIYIVSNTPSYLFRHFRIDPSVQRFAQQNTANDLFAFAQEIAASRERTLNQVVQAYAALVALSFKQGRNVEADPRLLQGLDWARSILTFGSSRQTTTAQSVLTLKPELVTQHSAHRSRTTSQYKSIRVG